MNKFLFVCLLFVCSCFAVIPNGDEMPNNATTIYEWWPTGFTGAAVKYSPAFNLTDYENIILTVAWNDEAHAGRGSDSAAFYYGIQLGYISQNYSSLQDTEWVPFIVGADSIGLTTTKVGTPVWRFTDSIGNYTDQNLVDTLSLTSLSCVSKSISPARYPIARCVLKGLTGNIVSRDLWIRMSILRAKYFNIKDSGSK